MQPLYYIGSCQFEMGGCGVVMDIRLQAIEGQKDRYLKTNNWAVSRKQNVFPFMRRGYAPSFGRWTKYPRARNKPFPVRLVFPN